MQITDAEPSFETSPGEWLIASSQGVWQGRPGGTWAPFGVFGYEAKCVRRGVAGSVVAGGDGGLWLAVPGADRWRQLHDETLTMVQDVAPVPSGPGWLVASAYGVHSATPAAHGAWRWCNHREGDPDPSACFTLALLGLDAGGDAWLAATEAGLWRSADGGRTWTVTAVAEVPVRALTRGAGCLWAGADDGSLWRSANGDGWEAVAGPGAPILAVHELPDGRLLAGTPQGLRLGGPGAWTACGPPLTVLCVVAAPDDARVWIVGAHPGGLWWTADAGGHWHQEACITAAVHQIDVGVDTGSGARSPRKVTS